MMATSLWIRHGKHSEADETVNFRYGWVLLVALVGLGTVCILFRAFLAVWNKRQTKIMARAKKHLIYAPLIRSSHAPELQISSASGELTIPTRLQTCIIVVVVTINVVLQVTHLPWTASQETIFPTVRNRAGVMATANLVPLVLLAGRHNPLTSCFGISFSTVNLFHRWLGRIIVVEAVVHASMWIVAKSREYGWAEVSTSIRHSEFILTGLIACIAFVTLGLHSSSIIRHAFYETFLHSHILFACLAFGALWHHLEEFQARRYLIAAVSTWAVQRFIRSCLVVWRNCSLGHSTKGTVTVLPGDACQISLTLARPWTVQPGQYIFLYLPSVGVWTSHPFSVAWFDQIDSETPKEVPTSSSATWAASKRKEITIHLIVRRRTGFTADIYEKMASSKDHVCTISPLVEGPYGAGQYCLDSYETVLLFAGGVGITHQLPYARHLLNSLARGGAVACQQILLVWAIQSSEHIEWARRWLESLFRVDQESDILRVQIFITKDYNPANMAFGLGDKLRLFSGRPDINSIVRCKAKQNVGPIAVTSCGPGGMSDQVRNTCREYQYDCNIDYYEGNFYW